MFVEAISDSTPKVYYRNQMYLVSNILASQQQSEIDVLDFETTEHVLDSNSKFESFAQFTPTGTSVSIDRSWVHSSQFMRPNGTTGTSTSWKYVTIPEVSYLSRYHIVSTAGQDARLWLQLDSNGQVISCSSDSSTVGTKSEIVTIQKNATILVVNSRLYTSDTPMNVVLMDGYSATITTPVQYFDPSNTLYNKILVCAGDSITQGVDIDASGITDTSSIVMYQSNGSGDFTQVTTQFRKTYGWQIASRNNMTFYNAGVSGSTMQGISNKNGFSLANGRYTKLPDDIDYLTIFFGWNDAAYGTLGTINDSTNESYYGAYNVVLPYLINKYPATKIALIVPFGTTDGHRQAIRLLANKWGLACFDMFQGGTPLYYNKESSVGVENSIVISNRAKFQANGAHPSYLGHKQIGDMLEHFLRGI